MFKKYEQIRKSNGNPEELLKEVTGNYTPEQMQNFMKFANGFGITNEQLSKYGINTK
jgi:hypothetical protein